MRNLYTNDKINIFLIEGKNQKFMLFEGMDLKIKKVGEINPKDFIKVTEERFNSNIYLRKNLSDKILNYLQRLHFGYLQIVDKEKKIEVLKKIKYIEKLYKELNFKIKYNQNEKVYPTYKIALRA